MRKFLLLLRHKGKSVVKRGHFDRMMCGRVTRTNDLICSSSWLASRTLHCRFRRKWRRAGEETDQNWRQCQTQMTNKISLPSLPKPKKDLLSLSLSLVSFRLCVERNKCDPRLTLSLSLVSILTPSFHNREIDRERENTYPFSSGPSLLTTRYWLLHEEDPGRRGKRNKPKGKKSRGPFPIIRCNNGQKAKGKRQKAKKS